MRRIGARKHPVTDEIVARPQIGGDLAGRYHMAGPPGWPEPGGGCARAVRAAILAGAG